MKRQQKNTIKFFFLNVYKYNNSVSEEEIDYRLPLPDQTKYIHI